MMMSISATEEDEMLDTLRLAQFKEKVMIMMIVIMMIMMIMMMMIMMMMKVGVPEPEWVGELGRRELVEWMMEKGEELELSTLTVHTAVR